MLNPSTFLSLLVTAAVLFILGRGNVTSLRRACGTLVAERIVIGLTGLTFLLVAIALISHSLPAFILAIVVGGFADITPAPIIALTGGPDPMCHFRRACRDVFRILLENPPASDHEVRLNQAFRELEVHGSPET
jgi:hypothetical protein